MLIRISVASREMGMELPTIRLALKSPKKMNSTAMEIRTPAISVFPTDHREEVMISLELYSTLISIPGFFSEYSAISFSIFCVTCTTLALCFFWMEILIFSMPSLLLMESAFSCAMETSATSERWTTLPAAVIIGTCSSFCTVLNSMAALTEMSWLPCFTLPAGTVKSAADR